MAVTRDWGPWTVIKLEALEKYFSAFTTASQRAKVTLYLDLFGGRPSNTERTTRQVFPGSALRAAQARPAFTRMIVTELDVDAAREQRAALAAVAGDRAQVLAGDCNIVMPTALAGLPDDYRWAATFALIDQFSAEISWETLRTLAMFKSPQASTKAELCMYFGESFLLRGIRGPKGAPNHDYAQRVDRMFGTDQWREIIAARDDGVLTGTKATAELVNLMRWQLETQLGYETTVPLQIRNSAGSSIFTMIFATDHEVGTKIMRSLFEGAEDALEAMVLNTKIKKRLERDDAAGQCSLFESEDLATTVADVRNRAKRNPVLPPIEPFRYGRLWDA